MDDVMDKMTRAEYDTLAMRLPRAESGEGAAAAAGRRRWRRGRRRAEESADAAAASDRDRAKAAGAKRPKGLRWISRTSSAATTPTPPHGAMGDAAAQARDPGAAAEVEDVQQGGARRDGYWTSSHSNFIASVSHRKTQDV